LTSFLLAHCGGGQDKPGCLGPSAKLPRHFSSSYPLLLFFPLSPWSLGVSNSLRTRCWKPRLTVLQSVPRYLCAACTCGQAISTVLVREDGSSPAATTAGGGIRTVPGKNSNAVRTATARDLAGAPRAGGESWGERSNGPGNRRDQRN
jgi:hypothetical protein